ncbi:MAG: MFS transporter [Sphingobium sp.]|nr:MAG: MFS transporter [Sphingobium sp.]
MAIHNEAARAEAGTFLGHPRGLFLLFFAEMWERFSFYGMRALLIFYLTKHFLFSDQDASRSYGAYMALVYVSPLVGGYLADRYLGQRKAVLFGGVMIAAGHVLLGIEGDKGAGGLALDVFWLGLATVVVGTGFLKANVSALVGQLYPRDDLRRDPAYTIFYMGINTGSAIGPIICGYLGEVYGWSWGFGAAAVGMVAGVIGFAWGRPLLQGAGEPPDRRALAERPGGLLSREWNIYVGSMLGVLLTWFLIQNSGVVGWMLIASLALVVVYLLYEAAREMPQNRHRLFAALFLLALNPIFWGLYEQTGSSLNLFTDRHLDRVILGWEVPASLFQSVNAIFILLLGPVFAWGWLALGRRGLEPSAPAKFGIAIVLVGAGFLVLVGGAEAFGRNAPTPVIFMFLLYLLHTMGELALSPVGLSAMSKLSPSRMIGLMMGIWFLAMAGGEFVAGMISAATGGEAGDSSQAGLSRILDVYGQIGWIAVAVGVVVMMIAPWIKRLMHLDTLGEDEEREGGRRAQTG